MEKENLEFIENNLLLTNLNQNFLKKKAKIGLMRNLTSILFEKKDGNYSNINNLNYINPDNINLTLEDCIKINYENILTYKNSKNKLIYTDNYQNNIEERTKINKPLSYENLCFYLQQDYINEQFINEKKGNLKEKNINNNNNNNNINKKNKKIENEIIFESNYEQGNLRMAIEINNKNNKKYKEYDLIIRRDINNTKNYSGFLFSVKSDKEITIKFNILNYVKNKVPFNNNKIKILCYSNNEKWTRNTFNVFYYNNNIPINKSDNNDISYLNNNNNNIEDNKINKKIENKDNNEEIINDDNSEDSEYNNSSSTSKCFHSLSFCYHISKENINTPIFFSYCYPYTFSMLQDFLYSISKQLSQNSKDLIRFSTYDRSICGNAIDILYITNFKKKISSKKTIFITGRIHPGESSGSYVVESVIKNLLFNEQYKSLLDKYIFKIIPMINVDGVINGNYRCNIMGKDLNRFWHEPNNITYEIMKIKNIINLTKPNFFCDFHGHSNMPNSSIYACSNKEEKVFVKIFEEGEFYNKDETILCISKSKKNTGRVVMFKEMKIRNSFAIETSIHSVFNKGNKNDNKNNDGIKLEHFEKIGEDFVNSLLIWSKQKNYDKIYKEINNEDVNVCSEIVKNIIKEENENYLDYIFKNKKLNSFDLKKIENYDENNEQ